MRPAVFFRLRLRLSLQNTAELLNPDSLTQTSTPTGGGPVYQLLYSYINFFQPVMRLRSKIRHGTRVHKAMTPPRLFFERS